MTAHDEWDFSELAEGIARGPIRKTKAGPQISVYANWTDEKGLEYFIESREHETPTADGQQALQHLWVRVGALYQLGDLVDVKAAGRDHFRLVLAGAEGWRPTVKVHLTAPVEVTA